MTRKEVVKWLESLKRETGKAENRSLWHYAESIDMAIKALKAKTDGDLISRQDAIRWVKTECNPYGKPTLDFESGKKVIEHLEQMPSEEPKTGEWIPVSDIRKLEAVVYMHIDSLEGTRNIVEAGMLSAWKEVAEYVDGMLGEDGEDE